MSGQLLAATTPGFAAELEGGLRAIDRPDLAAQVPELRIRDVCRCQIEGCASFYTAMPMKRWFRRGEQVPVGELVVDTIDGEIVFVEVLNRPDLKALLTPR